MSTSLSSAATILPWLADFTLLATLWLGFLWLGMRCLKRLSAARRHVLLCAGLACLPVLMLGALRVPTWNFPVVVREEAEARKAVEPRATVLIDPFAPTTSAPLLEQPAQPPGMSFWQKWKEGLLLLWLAGIGVGMAAMLATAWRLQHLRRGSTLVQDERLMACWRQLCREAGVDEGKAVLIESAACSVPMTWGILRPVVLLPATAGEWPEERLRLVLRHELSHVARRDVLVALVSALTALPLWFHPLAWLVWRDAHEAREAACDDAALARSGEQAQVFAAQLLDAVTSTGTGPQWRLMPMALCMATRSAAALRRRLEAILDEGRQRSLWPRWQAGGITLALLTGALAVSGLSACRKTGAEAVMAAQQIVVFSKVVSLPLKSKTGGLLAGAFEGGTDPGMQLRGVLDEKQGLELLRKLDEAQEEVRILSAPTVTTRSGQKAVVEIVREFIYPTHFDPPVHEKGKPITPTTPTVFELRPVGVSIELLPQVGPGGIIDLETKPEITQFLGFVDYGSPISSEVTGPDGRVQETMLTPNKIQVPIFHSMKTSTSVTMWDGQYLIIGGLAEHKGEGLNVGESNLAKDLTKTAVLREENPERLVYFIIQPKLIR